MHAYSISGLLSEAVGHSDSDANCHMLWAYGLCEEREHPLPPARCRGHRCDTPLLPLVVARPSILHLTLVASSACRCICFTSTRSAHQSGAWTQARGTAAF